MIRPQDPVADTHVYLTFNRLDFDVGSVGDSLRVYEGDVEGEDGYAAAPLLGHFTGGALPVDWIRVASSSALTLRMQVGQGGEGGEGGEERGE